MQARGSISQYIVVLPETVAAVKRAGRRVAPNVAPPIASPIFDLCELPRNTRWTRCCAGGCHHLVGAHGRDVILEEELDVRPRGGGCQHVRTGGVVVTGSASIDVWLKSAASGTGIVRRTYAGVCAAISHGWNSYRWGPRCLNWGPGPELYGRSPHLYVFHPWNIRTQTLYCALSRGCLADPVRWQTPFFT